MKLLATVIKEARILYRDKAGLAILFIMPTALVLVVTLVQEDALRAVKGTATPVLFVNRDEGELGRDFEKRLAGSGYFDVVKHLDGRPLDEALARKAVTRGDYQICVVVPEGATDAAREGVEDLMDRALVEEEDSAGGAEAGPKARIVVYLDPAVRDVFRKAMINAMHRVVQAIEMKLIVSTIEELLGGDSKGPETFSAWEPGDLVGIRELFAGKTPQAAMPTSVQQNVPAWTLFAMFMIVVPLSGTIIKERDYGTLVRLRTLPVSYWTILSGKGLVYLVVCMIQFLLMLALGAFVMPWLGTPRLEVGSHYVAILVAALASGLAATGFGIMTGTIVRTHEQASVFGATFTVIAGALGGVMVPVFLMPQGMQAVSRLSPLNWGLNAFLDIFLRGAGVLEIMPRVLQLTGFFGATMLVAMLCFLRRDPTA